MDSTIPEKDARIHFIGIKGTGMCALAELMHNKGLHVSGSDQGEVFYTDMILKEMAIPYNESFDASHIESMSLPAGQDEESVSSYPDMVIYSAAYSAETNPEMAEAQRLGIPMYKYSPAAGDSHV